MQYLELSQEKQDLFTMLFPYFFTPPPKLGKERRNELERHFAQIPKVVIGEPMVARRFGGMTLPRSRYYSVASDSDGTDEGTLGNELRAYRDPGRTGMVEVLDFSIGRINLVLSEQQKISFDRSRQIGALIHEPLRVASALERVDHETIKVEDGRRLALVRFPFGVEYAGFENVIDLRVPSVREWFVTQFSAPDDQIIWPESMNGPMADPPKTILSVNKRTNERAPIPTNFVEMLPTMLNPMRGGGDWQWGGTTLFSIGEWFRNHGINAFIYPSARNDFYALVRKEEILESAGWCLLELLSPAESVEAIYVVFDSSPWSWVELSRGVEVRLAAASDEFFGSIALQGIQRSSAEDYKEQISCLNSVVRMIGPYPQKSTALEFYLIGVFGASWSDPFKTDAQGSPVATSHSHFDGIRILRGLLVRNGFELPSLKLGEIFWDFIKDGDLRRAAIDVIEVLTEVQNSLPESEVVMSKIIGTGLDLELSRGALQAEVRTGSQKLERPFSIAMEGICTDSLSEELASRVKEYFAQVACRGTDLSECVNDALQLSNDIRHYFASQT